MKHIVIFLLGMCAGVFGLHYMQDNTFRTATNAQVSHGVGAAATAVQGSLK